MQSIKTISGKCLLIKPDNSITSVVLAFDSQFCKTKNPTNYDIVCDNIVYKYKYGLNFLNFLRAPFPDHTYYSGFCQSTIQLEEQKHNRIASQITAKNCFGECIIVHFDTFYDLCDIDKNTFIKIYNGKYPKNPIVPKPDVQFEAIKEEKIREENIVNDSDTMCIIS